MKLFKTSFASKDQNLKLLKINRRTMYISKQRIENRKKQLSFVYTTKENA